MIKPTGPRILCEPIASPVKTVKGIHIPNSSQETPVEATVVAVGTPAPRKNGNRIDFDIKVGDRVIMQQYRGTEIKSGGRTFKLMDENEILAVID